MTVPPLMRLAKAHRADLLHRHALACAGPDAATALHLADQVDREAFASVNMRPAALLEFVKTGERWHAWELATRQAAASGHGVQHHLRDNLGRHYPRRVQFERRFAGDVHFHYAAVNLGGLGSPRYGQLCCVFQRCASRPPESDVVVDQDTLTGDGLRDAIGRLLERRLAKHLATPDAVGPLLAQKHASALQEVDPDAWPEALCNNDVYSELISVHPPKLDDMQEVRIPEATRKTLEDRALGILVGTPSLTDGLDLSQLLDIEAGLDSRGITLVEVGS